MTNPTGLSLPRLERCRAQVLLSCIQDAAIPTLVSSTLFQRPKSLTRTDALLQKIYVLTSDRRIVAFPGRLDDVAFSANKATAQGGKKKVISHRSALYKPQRYKCSAHIAVHTKRLSWSSMLLNLAFPGCHPHSLQRE